MQINPDTPACFDRSLAEDCTTLGGILRNLRLVGTEINVYPFSSEHPVEGILLGTYDEGILVKRPAPIDSGEQARGEVTSFKYSFLEKIPKLVYEFTQNFRV